MFSRAHYRVSRASSSNNKPRSRSVDASLPSCCATLLTISAIGLAGAGTISFGAFIRLQHEIDGLVHISQISEERVDKIKNVLKVGQEVTARVIKIDKGDRRIGLSIKAANYSAEQLKAEQAVLDSLKPGEDLVALQHAFDAADEAKQDKPD
jgi:predicted RNA-binding protein with RPS1 domain